MIPCPKCTARLDPAFFNSGVYQDCPGCGARVRTRVFRAAAEPAPRGQAAQNLVIADDAGCFYHPSKKAVTACSRCGRFLCSLCDIDMDNEHLCFPCMEQAGDENRAGKIETHRFLHDSLALRLAIFPMIIFWVTLVTAPVSLFIAVRYWKRQGSLAPRRKYWRASLAILISSAQILGWAGLFIHLATS